MTLVEALSRAGLHRKRLWRMLVVVAVIVGLSAALRATYTPDREGSSALIQLTAWLVTPLAVAVAAGSVTDDYRSGRFAAFLTIPRPRWWLAASLTAATGIVAALPVAALSVTACLLCMVQSPQEFAKAAFTVVLSAVLWAPVMTWLCMVSARPLLWGTLLIMFWDMSFAPLSAVTAHLSIAHTVNVLVPQLESVTPENMQFGAWRAAISALGIPAVALMGMVMNLHAYDIAGKD